MLDEAEAKRPSATQFRATPIWWWALFGAWVGLFVLDGALTGGGHGPFGSWIRLSSCLILLGPYLPRLFFDEDGREFAEKGIVSAARRHWSGVVGLLLMFAGAGLIVANVVVAPQTLRPYDWASVVVFILMPAASVAGVNGPRARFPIGAPISIAVAGAILIAGNAAYGDRLQWVYAQFNVLILGGFVLLAALLAAVGLGVLRFIDWMIARGER